VVEKIERRDIRGRIAPYIDGLLLLSKFVSVGVPSVLGIRLSWPKKYDGVTQQEGFYFFEVRPVISFPFFQHHLGFDIIIVMRWLSFRWRRTKSMIYM